MVFHRARMFALHILAHSHLHLHRCTWHSIQFVTIVRVRLGRVDSPCVHGKCFFTPNPQESLAAARKVAGAHADFTQAHALERYRTISESSESAHPSRLNSNQQDDDGEDLYSQPNTPTVMGLLQTPHDVEVAVIEVVGPLSDMKSSVLPPTVAHPPVKTIRIADHSADDNGSSGARCGTGEGNEFNDGAIERLRSGGGSDGAAKDTTRSQAIFKARVQAGGGVAKGVKVKLISTGPPKLKAHRRTASGSSILSTSSITGTDMSPSPATQTDTTSAPQAAPSPLMPPPSPSQRFTACYERSRRASASPRQSFDYTSSPSTAGSSRTPLPPVELVPPQSTVHQQYRVSGEHLLSGDRYIDHDSDI